MRILVVEDNESIVEMLVDALTCQHHVVDVARDGLSGFKYAETQAYDLILLDVMLPELNGISLCRKIRQRGNNTPILMLTAKSTLGDKIEGLDAGADDYLTKPFELKELEARIRALSRRSPQALPPVLEWGDLLLDPSTCQVTYGAVPLHLTPKEFLLLELFLRNPNRTFSRSAIVDRLWPMEDSPGEDTVKMHVRSLRRKLATVSAPQDAIETVYGMGYRLRQPPPQHDNNPKAS